MVKQLLISVSALSLVACNGNNGGDLNDRLNVSAEADFAPALLEAPQAMRKAAPDRVETENSVDPAGVFLAYRYGYGLVMPAASVKPTADKHMQICREAGPTKCQITGSNTNNLTNSDIRANLSLRAEPEWLHAFVISMKADIAEIDGRIANENTSVEDLTRAILDTDARLKAQTTLRTRLENLLETREAKLPDLLALERELARVQSEIESATANLKALRARVSMSIVNLSYTSERVAVSRSSVSPIAEALKDFVGLVSNGLAGVIRFIAILLPWMIFLILPGLFALRWFWRRRKKIKSTP